MDANQFCSILVEGLVESFEKLGMDEDEKIFQQDNDPKHTSKKAQRWLLDNNNIRLLDWPPQSPDINPLEHLWGHLKRQLLKYGIHISLEDPHYFESRHFFYSCFMTPKAFETGVYALETAFRISQPQGLHTIDHLTTTFTLTKRTKSIRTTYRVSTHTNVDMSPFVWQIVNKAHNNTAKCVVNLQACGFKKFEASGLATFNKKNYTH